MIALRNKSMPTSSESINEVLKGKICLNTLLHLLPKGTEQCGPHYGAEYCFTKPAVFNNIWKINLINNITVLIC